MAKLSTLRHQGTDLYYTDLSDSHPEEVIELCKKSQQKMKAYEFGSVLSLINVSNIRFDKDVIQVIKETTKANKPYIKASAVVGLSGFTKVLIKVVMSFSGRDLRVFDDLESAKNWLSSKASNEAAA
ncbi:MAG: STAS/SEC14 domain-containing protein [Cyclobacteriaceae bacterium]|nr:STAS/SEC14 domain-containing protein [Cyclobacteriaceae bacterium]MCH8515438.1 STAS/SEC14 domain-containing protein [Cyclobacteriaceae bacterium]